VDLETDITQTQKMETVVSYLNSIYSDS